MIILHESCDRIVQGSRPVIAESLYHGVFFCLPLYRKKVTELSCANMCKISKNGRKHLFNSAKYSIHLKHSKHPFMQKTAVRNPEMTAILQKRQPSEKRAALSQYRFSKGAFRASGLKQPVPQAHFALRAKRRCKCKIGAETSIYHPKSVADFAARRRQIILIVFSDVTVVALRLARPKGRANRATSSKPARFIRHWRRFADFHVRDNLHFSGRKCGIHPLTAGELCAQRPVTLPLKKAAL